MPTWGTQGSHRFYREEDLIFFEIHGMFEFADVQHMYVVTEAIVQDYGYVLTVFDARNASGISAKSRRYVGEKSRAGLNEGAAAIVGASFPVRTVITLLRNASRLIGRPQPPLQFCSNPADGVLWLAGQRPHIRAKVGRRG